MMKVDLPQVLRGLEDAAAFAERYRFELSEDYITLVEHVEALPENRSGADKSGVWRGSRALMAARLRQTGRQ